MEKQVKLDNDFEISKHTKSRQKQSSLIDYDILNDTIVVGQKLELKKGDKIKHINIDNILKIDEDEYHISNSNVTISIRRK